MFGLKASHLGTVPLPHCLTKTSDDGLSLGQHTVFLGQTSMMLIDGAFCKKEMPVINICIYLQWIGVFFIVLGVCFVITYFSGVCFVPLTLYRHLQASGSGCSSCVK